jgi:hypothetical protein
MYNRILNRPMFKRGGDVMDAKGTGITSGLDTPRQGYHRGRVVRPGGYKGDIKWQDIQKNIDIESGKYATNIDIQKEANIVTPEQKSKAFWTGISQFGGAKTLSEAVMRGVDAQSKAIKPYEEAVAKKDLMLTQLGGEAELSMNLKGIDSQTQFVLQNLNDKNRLAVQQLANEGKEMYQRVQIIKEKYTDADGKINTSDPGYIEDMEVIAAGFNMKEKALEVSKIILSTQYMNLDTKEGRKKLANALATVLATVEETTKVKTKATGGRVGYQFGTDMQGVQPTQGLNQPTQVGLNVDETISTPAGTLQEDISVQEKIKPSVDMTYEEFRAKMPPEVDDDIVQLIYYNEDAFADFAQIKTQDEVYAFNNKWGVTLVLPFNTEIT